MRRIALLLAVSSVLFATGVAPGVASQVPPSANSASLTYCTSLSIGKICATIIDRKWKRVCTYAYVGQMVAKRCRKVRR